MELKEGYKQTEVGVIPEDWEVLRISNITKEISMGPFGSDISVSSFVRTGVPVLSGRNVQKEKLSDEFHNFVTPEKARSLKKAVAKRGDIVVTHRGTIGQIAYIPLESKYESYVISQSQFRLRVDPHKSLPEWVVLYFRSGGGSRRLLEKKGHTGVPAIAQATTTFRKLSLPVPTIAEQEAIAETLSSAGALIESLEQLIAKKRQIKQGAMQELLTGKRRLPDFQTKLGYQQTELGLVPEDWQLMPLLAAVKIAQGQADPKIEPYKSMTLVGPVHVDSGTGKLFARQTAAEQGAISGKYIFQEGDIVYGKINPYLQKAFLATFEGLCSADMYPLRPSNDISPGFMLAVILGHQFTKYAKSVSVRSGMPKINREELAGFQFAIPRNSSEQEAIAGVLSDIDANIAALEAKLDKARNVRRGMMQQLLTGRIRLA